MGSLWALLEKLDPDSGIRGTQFEYICKWFLHTDPRYRSELQEVWLWNEWPGRWGADAGIDLVAKGRDGKLWAIQTKAYDVRYWITKSDVDTFLTESARRQFAYRLLIATTDRLGRTARRTIENQEKPVGLLLLGELLKADVAWPSSPQRLAGKPPKRKTPFPHNREAVKAVVQGFQHSDRGQLVMACGTGKTLVGLWVHERLESRRTLLLFPSLSLLAQTLREWSANARNEFSYLAVASDDTVRERDDLILRTTDLGLPATTDPLQIAAFLRRKRPGVIFATYHSSPQVAKAQRLPRTPSFDLAIADEAHRCAGPVAGTFATILKPDLIHAKHRLFMTATPKYFTNRVRREGAQQDFEIASMDDETLFGPVFHSLTFGEAIERDILTDYQVAIIGIDNATWRRYAETGRFVRIGNTTVTDARTLAGQIGLAKALRAYDLRRVISFHGRVARARSFSKTMGSLIQWMPSKERPTGNLWSHWVSGEMTSGERDVFLRRFRHLEEGERALLSNARCLGEGVDVPTIDGVAFIDPRRSQIDVVQAVGRVIRRSEQKKVGTIILPVFVGSTEDSELALDSSAFSAVWAVLKALRVHDNILAEELDSIRRSVGRLGAGGARRPGKIKINMPASISKEFVESLNVRLVERATSSWEFMLGLLQQYSEREGDARVPVGHH